MGDGYRTLLVKVCIVVMVLFPHRTPKATLRPPFNNGRRSPCLIPLRAAAGWAIESGGSDENQSL